jgi:hypothetical protein
MIKELILSKIVDIALKVIKKRRLLKRFKEVCGYDSPEELILDAISMNGTVDKIEEAARSNRVSERDIERYIELHCKRIFTEEWLDEVELDSLEVRMGLSREGPTKREAKKGEK